jgi:hypothetical protein
VNPDVTLMVLNVTAIPRRTTLTREISLDIFIRCCCIPPLLLFILLFSIPCSVELAGMQGQTPVVVGLFILVFQRSLLPSPTQLA